MGTECQFGAESHRLQQHQLVFIPGPGGVLQLLDLGRMHTDKLIFQKSKILLRQGIDDKTMAELSSSFFEGNPFDLMEGEMLVQLKETFLVFGQTDVLLLYAVAEVDADHGMDALLLGLPDKREYSCRTVNIGQRQGIKFLALRLRDKFSDRQAAVFKAEVGVAVEVHGNGKKMER